jgi:hypothetical protein
MSAYQGYMLIPRYFTEGAFDPIAVVAGLIQTAIYADFGYIVSLPDLPETKGAALTFAVCHKVS